MIPLTRHRLHCVGRLAILFAILLFTRGLSAQDAEPSSPASDSVAAMNDTTTTGVPEALLSSARDLPLSDITTVIVVVLLLVAGAGVYLLIRRLGAVTGSTAMQDAMFEAQVMQQLRTQNMQDQPLEQKTETGSANAGDERMDAQHIPLSIETASARSEPSAANSSHSEISPARAIIRKLEIANLVDHVEQVFQNFGQKEYAVSIVLRNRQRALVVSQLETEQYTAHNLKRYDLLFYATAGGSAIVVTRVEDLIADALSGRMR